MTTITGRDRRPTQPREMREYAVLRDAHIADERGRSQFYAAVGEDDEPTIVRLTPEDAKYWLMDGVIRPQETITEAPRERTQSAKRRRS